MANFEDDKELIAAVVRRQEFESDEHRDAMLQAIREGDKKALRACALSTIHARHWAWRGDDPPLVSDEELAAAERIHRLATFLPGRTLRELTQVYGDIIGGDAGEMLDNARDIAIALVMDDEYQASLKQRLIAGTVPPDIEATLWFLAYGSPAANDDDEGYVQ